MSLSEVLSGERRWHVEQADCLEWLSALPADSVDLVFGSPPYTGARSYLEDGQDLGIARDAEAWSAWMVQVTVAALRVCRGPVCWVVEGQTRDYRWDAAPLLLGADLVRAGVCLRRCCYYRRVGIPGSGGRDWFRCDAEPIIVATRGGPLPWADVTACGHPPRWAPGGAMSHRLQNGQRVNQWGMTLASDGSPTATSRGTDGAGPSDAKKRRTRKPSHVVLSKTRRRQGSDVIEQQSYSPPVLANPGNVVQQLLTAQEVDDLLVQAGEYVDCKVGGGHMGAGDRFSRQNEAPFPEQLPERFVRSFAAPDGVVCDPFSGSGTTAAVAIRWGRRFVGCDLRPSQVELARQRLGEVTPDMFESPRQ